MFSAPIDPIYFVIQGVGLAVCLLAFWKGDRAEQLGALLLVLNSVAFIGLALVLSPSTTAVLLLADDGLTALALLAITLRYGSLWLGGVMLFYAAQFTLHSFYFVTERAPDRLHAIINNFDFVAMMMCLAVGVSSSWRRRRRLAAAA
jgi:hypothetical protein